MPKMNKYVATSSDANYFPGLIALLRSLKKTNPGLPIVVFDGGLTPGQRKKAAKYAEILAREPFFRIKGRGKFSYIGDTTLLKFWAAKLEADVVLYLDADMVVLEDLSPLFAIPAGKVGAVMEKNTVRNMFRKQHRDILSSWSNMNWDVPGFNAGLFVLRPSEWRDLPEKAETLFRSMGEEVFAKTKDQQLLNVLFAGHVHPFSPRYNFSPFYDDAAGALPAVIHFLYNPKPWHYDYPLDKFYRYYRSCVKIWDHPSVILGDVHRVGKRICDSARVLKSARVHGLL
jgi:lipopolysaccharide biosynthesis glycosyltransferase